VPTPACLPYTPYFGEFLVHSRCATFWNSWHQFIEGAQHLEAFPIAQPSNLGDSGRSHTINITT